MKHISLKFSALLIPFYAMWAIGPGFFVVVLEQKGIAANEIAIYTCIVSLVAALVQPLMGYLCDKTGKAKTIMSVSCIMSVLVYLWLCFISSPLQLAVCSVLIGTTIYSMYGFGESWLSKLNCTELGVNFGAVRSLGSLSYAVTAAVYGQLFDAFGTMALPVAMGAICLILVPVAMICPNPQVSEKQQDNGQFSVAFKNLMANRRFVLVVICYTLAVLPSGASNIYYSLHIRQLGGSAGDVGLALLVLAGTEALVMSFYKKLENKFGAEKLLAFAFFMYGVKALCIGFSNTVPTAIMAAATQGLCFSLSLPGVQSYVDNICPREYSATAQMVSNTGGQIVSQVMGLVVAGILTSFISVGATLSITSVFAFISGTVFVFGIRKLNRTN